MLVLTRKVLEQIQIGDDVIVTVLSIDGNRVRLGIEAPPEVGVRRIAGPKLRGRTEIELTLEDAAALMQEGGDDAGSPR